MKKKLFIVTGVTLGWDCIMGVYEAESEGLVKAHLLCEWEMNDEQFEEDYHIHEKIIQTL